MASCVAATRVTTQTARPTNGGGSVPPAEEAFPRFLIAAPIQTETSSKFPLKRSYEGQTGYQKLEFLITADSNGLSKKMLICSLSNVLESHLSDCRDKLA